LKERDDQATISPAASTGAATRSVSTSMCRTSSVAMIEGPQPHATLP
jgi:hypothetical protein